MNNVSSVIVGMKKMVARQKVLQIISPLLTVMNLRVTGKQERREMKRIKLLLTRLYNNYLFKNKYVCPVCAEGLVNWSYSPAHCTECGRKMVKQNNRFNLCPQCGYPKHGADFCRVCGHAFMRIKEEAVGVGGQNFWNDGTGIRGTPQFSRTRWR